MRPYFTAQYQLRYATRMRTALAFVVLLVSTSSVQADPGARAMTVIDALRVDTQTSDKLIDIVVRYDSELARLQRQRIEVKRRLVLAQHDHPKEVEFLLDDAIANQRALAQNEEQLIRRARKILGPRRAAELLVLINATEQDDSLPLTGGTRPGYDPNALFPPPAKTPCNPFESMHGCRR
jgi:hypothetical protein